MHRGPTRWIALALVLSAVVVAVRAGTAAQAAPASAQPDVLPALLTEVRALRVAMEQMAAAGPRVQLAMGRLQLQEQRINTLLRRLESTRDSIRGLEKQIAEGQDGIGRAEQALRQTELPGRLDLERQVAAERRALVDSNADLQRLAAEEASLVQEIATEQARWNDINTRLEELDRALTRR
jgi:chromosome segregation ATPase